VVVVKINEAFGQISTVILPLIQRYRGELGNLEITTKDDRTLLTRADLDVQRRIVEVIRDFDNGARIIAEEDTEIGQGRGTPYTWIVDPIDGTAEFVSSDGREFCTAICVLEEGTPRAALIIMPELGTGRHPLKISASSASGEIFLNDQPAPLAPTQGSTVFRISATRSRNTVPRPFEQILTSRGCTLKTRTTSQTIDLARVALDLSPLTEDKLDSFDLFYREDQKLWDGAPGILLNRIAGRIAVGVGGNQVDCFSPQFLDLPVPVLPKILVGTAKAVSMFRSFCDL
jgi:3'(2'), 5'-bisphosphate nucleotidase